MNVNYLKELDDTKIEEYSTFYKQNDYVLIKDILTPEAINIFRNSENIEWDDETLKDKLQFTRRHNTDMISNNIIKDFQEKTLDFYKKIIDNKLQKTCAFAINYNKDSYVFPHLDLIINEVSSTICFSSNEDYPIFISSNFIENNYNHRYTEYLENIPIDSIREMNIKPGDIGIFNGRNHLHWRNKQENNINYSAILSHYILTIPGSEEWKSKTILQVPFENSCNGPIYNK